MKHSHFVELVVALLTLRHDLTLRAVEALTGLDHVTIMRICDRVAAALGDLRRARREAPYWIVDGTHTRASLRGKAFYTGYKKKASIKAQVVTDDLGFVVAADGGFPGSWHDKRIWERLVSRLKPDRPVLADKGYTGGTGEGVTLFRPTKSNAITPQPEIPDHNRKRVKVEHALARLKRFRCLQWWLRSASKHTNLLRLIAEINNTEMEVRLAGV